MKTTRLIGLKWKRREACSLQVLIGRGLDLLVLLFTSFLFLLYSVFRGLALKYIVGVNCYEVPPVPIPNTEVKLIHAEDT